MVTLGLGFLGFLPFLSSFCLIAHVADIRTVICPLLTIEQLTTNPYLVHVHYLFWV